MFLATNETHSAHLDPATCLTPKVTRWVVLSGQKFTLVLA
jgi:hypothetical protein